MTGSNYNIIYYFYEVFCVTNLCRHNKQGLFSWASHCLGIPGAPPSAAVLTKQRQLFAVHKWLNMHQYSKVVHCLIILWKSKEAYH